MKDVVFFHLKIFPDNLTNYQAVTKTSKDCAQDFSNKYLDTVTVNQIWDGL